MANKGKKQTVEHIAKRIATRRANDTYKHSDETRAKIASMKIGVKQSSETLKKRSVSLKAYYALHPEKSEDRARSMRDLHASGKSFSRGKHWKKTEDQLKNVRGEKNPSWKGGIVPLYTKIRNSKEYSDWRNDVFKRDNYTCRECGATKVVLNADHIKPFAYYPELRFVLDNGRTLCVPCHKETDTFAGRAKKLAISS